VPFAEPQAFTELGCVLVGDPNALCAQLSADADRGVAWLEALESSRRAGGSGAAPTRPGLGGPPGSGGESAIASASAFYQVLVRALPNVVTLFASTSCGTPEGASKRNSYRQGGRRSLAVSGEA